MEEITASQLLEALQARPIDDMGNGGAHVWAFGSSRASGIGSGGFVLVLDLHFLNYDLPLRSGVVFVSFASEFTNGRMVLRIWLASWMY